MLCMPGICYSPVSVRLSLVGVLLKPGMRNHSNFTVVPVPVPGFLLVPVQVPVPAQRSNENGYNSPTIVD